jgi:hypothetical protein
LNINEHVDKGSICNSFRPRAFGYQTHKAIKDEEDNNETDGHEHGDEHSKVDNVNRVSVKCDQKTVKCIAHLCHRVAKYVNDRDEGRGEGNLKLCQSTRYLDVMCKHFHQNSNLI